jgi:predicted nucleic acid-binding protein
MVGNPLVSMATIGEASFLRLDDGERAAITLAISLGADLVLMDERQGSSVARAKGLAVTGTIGVLDLAAGLGLVDLQDAFDRLKRTSFRYPPDVMENLLQQRKETKK